MLNCMVGQVNFVIIPELSSKFETFYIPTSNEWEFLSLHIFTKTGTLSFFFFFLSF